MQIAKITFFGRSKERLKTKKMSRLDQIQGYRLPQR